MAFKNFEWKILLRVILLLVMLIAAAFIIVKAPLIYLVFVLPIITYQVVEFYTFQRKAHDELSQFVESIHYRDFSRNFDVKHAPADIQPLRKGFNEINSTFKVISKEKE